MATRRSNETWQELFAAFEASGLSATAFCRERGIPAPYFRAKYRTRAPTRGSKRFQRVAVKPARSASVTLQVRDVTVQCDPSVPVEWLSGLVVALTR